MDNLGQEVNRVVVDQATGVQACDERVKLVLRRAHGDHEGPTQMPTLFPMRPQSALPVITPRHSGGPEPSVSLAEVLSVGGLIDKDETRWLMELAKHAPLKGWGVNLGTLHGLSASALCAVMGSERVITIDHFTCHGRYGDEPPRTFSTMKSLGLAPRFIDSESWQVPTGADEIALIFIDTTHEAQVLKQELSAWLGLLGPDSIVALHDHKKPPFHSYVDLIDRTFVPPLWNRLGKVGTLIAFRRTR